MATHICHLLVLGFFVSRNVSPSDVFIIFLSLSTMSSFCCSSTLLTITGDDCKGKQRVETRIVQSSSRVCRSHHVLGELWLATAYSGYLLSDQTLAYPHTLQMNESSSTFLVPCFLLLGWAPGSSVLWAGQKAGLAVRSVMRRMLSVLWLAAVSPGHHFTMFQITPHSYRV